MQALEKIEVAPGVWLRRGGLGRSFAVSLSGFVTVLMGASTLLGLAATIARPEKPFTTMIALCLGFALTTALFGYLTARLVRAGLRVTDSEVCLRGIVRTHRMALAGVDEFAPGIFRSGGTSEMGVKIRRMTMPDLDVWALGIGSAPTEGGQEHGVSMLQPLCESLNRLLDEMRQQGPSLPSEG